MEIKRKTFEDFFGDVADNAKDAIDGVLDDAKDAFDKIFERTAKKNGGSTSLTTAVSVAPAVRGAIVGVGASGTEVTAAIAKLSGSVTSLTDAVQALAALPEPIAELSNLISSLLVALQSAPGIGAVAGSGAAAGA
jgi:hypothetical protein